MGVRKESRHLSRGKISAIVMVTVAIITLVAIVICLGVRAHAMNVAQARQAQAVTVARADCRKSVNDLKNAKAAFTRASNAKNVAAASKITAGQVKDKKTVTRLKNLLSDSSSYAPCTVSTRAELLKATRANKTTARTVAAHAVGLTAAARAVTASKKQLDDQKAKAAAEKKAQAEAKRKADQAAQVQTQARKSGAPHRTYHYQTRRTYTPRRTNHYYNHSNYQASQHSKGGRNNGNTGYKKNPGQSQPGDEWGIVSGSCVTSGPGVFKQTC